MLSFERVGDVTSLTCYLLNVYVRGKRVNAILHENCEKQAVYIFHSLFWIYRAFNLSF